MKDGGFALKKNKKFNNWKDEAPNDEWFWKNRKAVKFLVPDAEIEEPEHLKRKRLDKEK